MGLSAQHILLLLVIVLLLFGRNKISELMADVAKGIKSFKKGMQDDETDTAAKPAPKTIDATASDATRSSDSTKSH
jgi:sec-independent protein translocase protein TatA